RAIRWISAPTQPPARAVRPPHPAKEMHALQANEVRPPLRTKIGLAQHPAATRIGRPRCDCRWKAIRARNSARDSDADRPVVCSHPREQTALGPREALVDRSEERREGKEGR